MKKLFKSVISIVASATICLSSATAMLASAEENTKPDVSTIKHSSVMYEPARRDALLANSLNKYIGTVYTSANPSVLYSGNTLMSAFVDLDKIVKTKTTFTSENGSGSSTVTNEETVAMFTTFNYENQVWNSPKYIKASSKEWYVASVELFENKGKIYALCLEAKNSDNQFESLADVFPSTKIALHEYSSETNSFTPIKYVTEDSNKVYLFPTLIIENGNLDITWTEIDTKTYMASFAYVKHDGKKWGTQTVLTNSSINIITTIESEDVMFFVPGIINGRLAFAYTDNLGANNSQRIVIKNDTGSKITSKDTPVSFIFAGKLKASDTDCFYYISNNSLCSIGVKTVDKTNKVIKSTVATGLMDASSGFATKDGDLFYTSNNSLYEMVYNISSKSFDKRICVAKTEGEIFNFDIADIGEEEMVMILSEASKKEISKLTEDEADSCNSNIHYIRYDKRTANSAEPGISQPENDTGIGQNKPSNDKEDVKGVTTVTINYSHEEGSGFMILQQDGSVTKEDIINKVKDVLSLTNQHKVTIISNLKFPLMPMEGTESYECNVKIETNANGDNEPSNKEETKDEDKNDDKNTENPNIPDTGTTAAGVVAFGTLSTALAVMFIARKKKSSNNTNH